MTLTIVPRTHVWVVYFVVADLCSHLRHLPKMRGIEVKVPGSIYSINIKDKFWDLENLARPFALLRNVGEMSFTGDAETMSRWGDQFEPYVAGPQDIAMFRNARVTRRNPDNMKWHISNQFAKVQESLHDRWTRRVRCKCGWVHFWHEMEGVSCVSLHSLHPGAEIQEEFKALQ